MRINGPAREIVLKVVYYGPGMAGKTTNLTVVHDRVPSQAAGDLVMVDTHSERTLRFDLLAMEAGEVRGHRVRFEFYTVPGQSYYAATRRAVLAGADGVVFVADSRREALDENIEAMNEMLNNLRHHGLSEELPVVVQYNKQDLPTALKGEQLEPLMNVRGWPSMASVAIDGNGVMETMRAITEKVLEQARRSRSIPDIAPTSPVATHTGSWLISCYRCQAMLEVPDAKPGSVYACGICNSALEVVDPDRGLTRAPAAPSASASSGSRSAPREESGGYESAFVAQNLDQPTSALGTGAATPRSSQQVGAPFEVAGFDLVAPLDESVQGRRSRVRERATGRNLRALAINPALFRQPGYSEGFEPYVRLAGQAKHPYILPLATLSATRESAVLFSADPPDYEPLGHILARRRALAPPHAVGIIRQTALALEEAARHGVVHGWLRPDVVLVSPDGNVLIDEFACPKNHRFLVRELSGASAATEYYLAPEHLNEEIRSDVRSDIFMLGSLLFRMMTGEGLVTGYNAHEALHKVVANGARTLRSVQAGVSRDLDLFFQRLVASERKDRFQSYRELVDTLDKFGGGAKRQTLRLTQSTPASQPGSGQIRRSGTGQIRHTGTGQIRRTGTGQIRRAGSGQIPRSLGSNNPATRTIQRSADPFAGGRKQGGQGSGSAVGIVVVIALLVAAAVGWFVLQNPAATHSFQPVTSPAGSAPATPAHPTPTAAAAAPRPAQPENAAPGKSPSWLTPGQAPAAVRTPSVAPAPAVADPAIARAIDAPPPASDPRPVTDPNDRIGVVMEIASLERSQRFQMALNACERMPSVEERQAKALNVASVHDRLRQEVETRAAASKDINEVSALLKPALTLWGLPGDEDWAKAQLAAAEKRLGKKASTLPDPVTPATPLVPTPAPVAGPGEVAPPVAAELGRAAVVDGQINQALANNQPGLAQQGASTLDQASPEAGAIKRKIDLWGKRAEILARVLAERQPKLRVPHPTTNEMWDIVTVSANGMTVASAAGSKTDLTWGQVTSKDLARVCAEAAANPNAKADEHALATVMLLIVGDTVLASVQVKKGKGVIEPEVGADLDTLIGLQRRRDAVDLLAKAKDAAKAGNGKQLNDYLDQLRRLDKSLQPLVASDLAKLEESRKQGVVAPGPVSAGETPSGKDHVTFDAAEDLKTFSERSGNWQLSNGMLANSGEGCRLGRKDLKDARALHLIFMPMAMKGAMIVDFRGVRLVIDFTSSTYQAISREETLKPKPFTFLAKAACSLYFEVKQPNNFVSIEVNNGTDTMGIKGGELSDNLGVGLDSGALIALDEVQISRGAPIATNKAKQDELRKLGLEPLGNAYLEAPAIVLPNAPSGGLSGLAMPIKSNIVGATFEVKGAGVLRVQLGNPNDRSGQWIDVQIGSVPITYKVTWTATSMVVSDAAGVTTTVALTGGHTHFMIIALQEATLPTTPRLTYQ